MWTFAPVRGLSHRGVIAAGVKPPWLYRCKWAFPMKIELFWYDTKFFFAHLPVRWSPPPRKRSPRGGSGKNNFLKKTLPAVPRRDNKAGFHRLHYDFHSSGVNHRDLCLFLQSLIILVLEYGRTRVQDFAISRKQYRKPVNNLYHFLMKIPHW